MSFRQPPARYGHVSATVGTKVYIWGGTVSDPPQTVSDPPQTVSDTHLNEVRILDTTKEKWLSKSTTGQHPHGFLYCASAQSGNMLYVYGGQDVNKVDTGALHSLNLDLLSWTELSRPHSTNAPKIKRDTRMVVHGDKIILFGGIRDGARTNELHELDLKSGLWSSITSTGDIPSPRSEFSFLSMNDGTVVVFGGCTGEGVYSDELYTLNLTKMHWSKIPHKVGKSWPERRKEHAATFLSVDTRHMIVSGGYSNVNDTHIFYDDMWLLDVTSMTWKKAPKPSTGNVKCDCHTAAAVHTTEDITEIVLFGGAVLTLKDVAKTRIYRFERLHDPSSTATYLAEEWKMTDFADADTLGSSDRFKYKRAEMKKYQQGKVPGGAALPRSTASLGPLSEVAQSF